jgi:hypothetical protein
MATPRRPEPPKKIGFGGVFVTFLVLGGIVWLLMLVFGWGPYKPAEGTVTPTLTGTLPALAETTLTPTETPVPTTTTTQTTMPTITDTPTLEPLPFTLFGEPETWSSDLLRPQLGCDWLVIAGQVWDLKGESVIGLTLHLYGELAGNSIDKYMITGSATTYGESGYEFALDGMVVDSTYSLYIQLVDTNGLALSHPYAIQTYEDCQQNLILVNFKQVR